MGSPDPKRRLTVLDWQESYRLGDNPDVRALYASDCFAMSKAPASAVDRPLTPSAIAEWKRWLGGIVEYSADLSALDTLAEPATRVVVTGQQAVIGLGPLYVLYKALAARHWAARYQTETGRRCVPIFWVASDDHDLEEIRLAYWLTPGLERRVADFSDFKGRNFLPAYETPLAADSVDKFYEEFFSSVGETEFAEELLDLLAADTLERVTFETSFVRLLCRLLLPIGVIPIVPRLSFIRKAQRDMLLKEAAHWETTNRLVQEQGQRIAAAGCDPPIYRSGNEFNFFLVEDCERLKIARDGDGWTLMGSAEQRLTEEEFAALLAKPEQFSPNVITRPILQDMVLPTVGYVGGPTEVVYHAQIGAVYDHFSVARPAVIPRPNVTLLEPRMEKAIARLGLEASVVARFRSAEALKALALETLQDARLGEALAAIERMRSEIESGTAQVAALFADPAVDKAAHKLREGLTGNLARLEERLRAVAERSDSERSAAIDKLIAGLFPGGIIQERSIGIFSPLLLNYGTRIIVPLAEAIQYDAVGYQLVSLRELSAASANATVA